MNAADEIMLIFVFCLVGFCFCYYSLSLSNKYYCSNMLSCFIEFQMEKEIYNYYTIYIISNSIIISKKLQQQQKTTTLSIKAKFAFICGVLYNRQANDCYQYIV